VFWLFKILFVEQYLLFGGIFKKTVAVKVAKKREFYFVRLKSPQRGAAFVTTVIGQNQPAL